MSATASKILVPLDGSEASLATLKWAVHHLGTQHQYMLLHVVNRTDPQLVVETYQVEEALQALDAGKAVVTAAGGTVASAEYVENGAVQGIVDYAKEMQPDLVLLGSHGRTGLAKVVMGSVSEKVFAQSPVPVVLYRNVG